MPIYEFYCQKCHTVFSFYSSRVNTDKNPDCPRCKKQKLRRQMSTFATVGRASENEQGDLPVDEGRLEQALQGLAREAQGINEDDPRQVAGLMRRLTRETGLDLGGAMEEALGRMEKGESAEDIEKDLGDLLETEDPLSLIGAKKTGRRKRAEPERDETLYEL